MRRLLVASLLVVLAGCDGTSGTPIPPAQDDAGTAPADAAVPPPPEPESDTIALDEAPEVQSLPPIAGGSLLVTDDRILAGDPDRATIWVLDPDAPRVVGRLVVGATDEPGRMVADRDGIAHVVLRGAGEVLDLDPRDGTLLRRRAVCPAPRGIDWDATRDVLLVACAGGELVGLPPAGGDAEVLTRLDPDLRDVLVMDDVVHVSRFRSAELLDLDRVTYEVRRRVAHIRS